MFLESKTNTFVENLFETLVNKTYMNETSAQKFQPRNESNSANESAKRKVLNFRFLILYF